MPKGFKGLAAKLQKLRANIVETVDYLKKEQSPEYLDLFARKLVDVIADIYIGYLLMDGARFSNRKAVIAKRWLQRIIPQGQSALKLIASGDRSTIDKYDLLVGPVPEES